MLIDIKYNKEVRPATDNYEEKLLVELFWVKPSI